MSFTLSKIKQACRLCRAYQVDRKSDRERVNERSAILTRTVYLAVDDFFQWRSE